MKSDLGELDFEPGECFCLGKHLEAGGIMRMFKEEIALGTVTRVIVKFEN